MQKELFNKYRNKRKELKVLKRKQHLIAMALRKKYGIFGEKGSLYEWDEKQYKYLDDEYKAICK